MGIKRLRASRYVMTMTLLLASGCSLIQDRLQESCQSHAYTQTILTDYIATRYTPQSPVRIGVIPASAPVNMSTYTAEQPGAGILLSERIHQDLLNFGELPIVEILNRNDWPGKKEEFFSGNFGAIRMGREAGYDLVVITFIEPPRSMDALSAYTKVIDTESGVTIYYGKSTVVTERDDLRAFAVPFGMMKREPALIHTNDMISSLGQCISQAIMAEKTTPR